MGYGGCLVRGGTTAAPLRCTLYSIRHRWMCSRLISGAFWSGCLYIARCKGMFKKTNSHCCQRTSHPGFGWYYSNYVTTFLRVLYKKIFLWFTFYQTLYHNFTQLCTFCSSRPCNSLKIHTPANRWTSAHKVSVRLSCCHGVCCV